MMIDIGSISFIMEVAVVTQLAAIGPPSEALALVVNEARGYAAQGVAENTQRAHRSDWSDFAAWCATHGAQDMPATTATIVLYVADRARELKASTLTRRLGTISQAHRVAGFESPTSAPEVRAVMRGIRRTKGMARETKSPVLTADLSAMVARLPGTLLGKRDRALLLLGFAGGFRRSEIVSLDVADLDFNSEGATVTLRQSKTDQTGEGRKLGIPLGRNEVTCPVTAIRAWIGGAGIAGGPLFRSCTRRGKVGAGRLSAQTVARRVKLAAKSIGLDPASVGGHSLRSGLATSAAANGASERAIAKQTGHRSMAVLRGYIRDGSLYLDNAASAAGL